MKCFINIYYPYFHLNFHLNLIDYEIIMLENIWMFGNSRKVELFSLTTWVAIPTLERIEEEEEEEEGFFTISG